MQLTCVTIHGLLIHSSQWCPRNEERNKWRFPHFKADLIDLGCIKFSDLTNFFLSLQSFTAMLMRQRRHSHSILIQANSALKCKTRHALGCIWPTGDRYQLCMKVITLAIILNIDCHAKWCAICGNYVKNTHMQDSEPSHFLFIYPYMENHLGDLANIDDIWTEMS